MSVQLHLQVPRATPFIIGELSEVHKYLYTISRLHATKVIAIVACAAGFALLATNSRTLSRT
jgi:hypothetical protein